MTELSLIVIRPRPRIAPLAAPLAALLCLAACEGVDPQTPAGADQREEAGLSDTMSDAMSDAMSDMYRFMISSPPDASPPPDMSVDLGPSFDQLFDQCIERMKQTLRARREELCGHFTPAEQGTPAYQLNTIAAACIRVECTPVGEGARLIDGHNGYMAARSCSGLEELERALTGAAAQANGQGGCADAKYSVRLITAEQFASNEFTGDAFCDQLTCDVEGGDVIFADIP